MCFSCPPTSAVPIFFVVATIGLFACSDYSDAQILRRNTIAPTPVSRARQEPRWYPYVFARGDDRELIQETPMVNRPYRPMHFYGNTIRRMHYRGNPAPLPRDLVRTTSTLIFRR